MDYISNLSGRSWVKIETLCVMTNQKLSIRNLSGRDFICQRRTNISKETIKLCSYLSRIYLSEHVCMGIHTYVQLLSLQAKSAMSNDQKIWEILRSEHKITGFKCSKGE